MFQPHEVPPLPPGAKRNWLLVTMLLMSLMAALDLTIVTVTLPYMAGNLSATSANIGWVITMYAVSSAVSIGITGHLSRIFGRKRLIVIAITGFITASVMCGLAQNLSQIVAFRFLQGAFSGPLIPEAQAILVDAFPPAERIKGITFWVMGVMVGPAMGPALGGWLAEDYSWRWIFWVNVPVGLLTLFLIAKHVRPVAPQPRRTDWLGLGLLLAFILSLQMVLDRGDIEDWFGSKMIVLLAIFATATGLAFIWRGWSLGPANIINLRLLSDRTFTVCTLLITMLGVVLLAVLTLMPQVFVNYFGWEVSTAGLVIGSWGVAGLAGSFAGGKLCPLLGLRPVILISCGFMAIGWWCFSRLNLEAGIWEAVLPGLYIQFGLLLTYGTLATVAFKNLPSARRDDAAALYNFMKTMGFSFGVTAVSTYLYRGTQANWTQYVGDLDFTKPGFGPWVMGLQSPFKGSLERAYLADVLSRQVDMVTFVQAADALCAFAMACSLTAFLLPGLHRIRLKINPTEEVPETAA